jgi:hypothetical protein
MRKQLRFLYRYFITTRRWRRLINLRSLLLVLVSAAFFITLASTSRAEKPSSQPLFQAVPTVTAPVVATQQPSARPTVTRTPFPPEFAANRNQTIGITLAGAVLVLIIVVGALTWMPREEKR